MTTHHFDTNIAQQVGVNAAIIYQNISFWIEKNKANGKHNYEDRHWTYNSISAFEELFPYLGAKAIRNALKKLVNDGYLVVGEFNKIAYDRTRWYALGDRMFTDLPKGQMGGTQTTNGDDQKGEPIPDNKPDNKPFKRESAPAKKSAVHSKTSLDPDTPLSDENFNAASQYFTSKGKPLLNPLDEWQKFIAYYVSQGEKRENWDAAWQSWYMKSVEFDRPTRSDSLRRPLADDMNDRSWAF